MFIQFKFTPQLNGHKSALRRKRISIEDNGQKKNGGRKEQHQNKEARRKVYENSAQNKEQIGEEERQRCSQPRHKWYTLEYTQ